MTGGTAEQGQSWDRTEKGEGDEKGGRGRQTERRRQRGPPQVRSTAKDSRWEDSETKAEDAVDECNHATVSPEELKRINQSHGRDAKKTPHKQPLLASALIESVPRPTRPHLDHI